MKKKSSIHRRTAAICLAGLLSVCCLTTACQPTPELEAVVNQKDGVPEDALIGESESADPEATTAPAARYTAQEKWDDTIDKAANFKVTADVDVLMPDVSAYPVEKLAPREITQELADQLMEYFAPGAVFYSMDIEKTKAEWEQQILDLREVIQAELEDGDTETAADDQTLLDEWTRLYEKAPEQVEAQPTTPVFAEKTDYSGDPLEGGPIYIDVWAESENGSDQQISVRKRNPEDPMAFPYFTYMNAEYTPESLDRQNQQYVALERASAAALEEPARSEELERLDEFEQEMNRRLALYDTNTLDLEDARRRGESVLEDLNIRGAQVFTAEKALIGPFSVSAASVSALETECTEPAVYLTFQRENGGIPCVAQDSQNAIPNAGRLEYSAPFTPERGTLVFDENWNVRVFQWDSPTTPVEIVAPDSRLISLDEAKERLVEELYRNELAVSETYIQEHGLRYDVEEMKLVMGYTDVPGEPDDALAIPAWYMKAQGMQLNSPDDESERILYNQQEVMISALDGAVILMPGTAQSYNYNYGEAD